MDELNANIEFLLKLPAPIFKEQIVNLDIAKLDIKSRQLYRFWHRVFALGLINDSHTILDVLALYYPQKFQIQDFEFDLKSRLRKSKRRIEFTIKDLEHLRAYFNHFDLISFQEHYKSQTKECKLLILEIYENYLNKLSIDSKIDCINSLFEEIEPCEYLVDAPLIVDLTLKLKLCDSLQDHRYEYLRNSLKNIILASGNISKQIEAPKPGVDDLDLVKKISEVKDLFPDYGDGYIQILLEEYKEVEVVLDKIFSGLPDYLAKLDTTLPARVPDIENAEPIPYDQIELLETPIAKPKLPERKNVFDNDKYDIFANGTIPKELVHTRKTNEEEERKSFLKHQKEKILELASFEDDEYDDTYDSTIVGSVEVPEDPIERYFAFNQLSCRHIHNLSHMVP